MRHVEARAGAYADSVTLKQVTAQAQAIPGVQAALVAMATDLNLGLLADLGLQPPDRAGPNDMLVAVQADDGAPLAPSGSGRCCRAAAADDVHRSPPSRDRPGADLGAWPVRVHRSGRRPRRGLRRDDLLRQRAGRGGGVA